MSLKTRQEHYAQTNTDTHRLSLVENYKANGDVGGGTAYALTGDHENRITDMTNILLYGSDIYREKIF